MKRIIFYISGHGFGHASRTCEVISAFWRLCTERGVEDEIGIELCSTAARWYFEETLDCPFSLRPVGLDVGAVQTDSLTLDVRATLAAYAKIVKGKEETLAREADYIRGADAVFADIPPAAFAAAERAGAPSMAMGNFSWDWIYEPYAREYPEYAHVIEDIRADYAKAALLLELPFAAGMDAFKHRKQIPLVCRSSRLAPADIRFRLGLNAEKKFALLSFGGIGLGPDFFRNLEDVKDWSFVCSEGASGFASPAVTNVTRENLRQAGLRYQDLVRASDVVVTKPGYGIVSECIANCVPMLYTSRGQFREYGELVGVIKKYLPSSRFVENTVLAEGAIAQALAEAASHARVAPDIGLDGARAAAVEIFRVMRF